MLFFNSVSADVQLLLGFDVDGDVDMEMEIELKIEGSESSHNVTQFDVS
jgi:hypothetical protein